MTLEDVALFVMECGDQLEHLGTKYKKSPEKKDKETRRLLRRLHQYLNENNYAYVWAKTPQGRPCGADLSQNQDHERGCRG